MQNRHIPNSAITASSMHDTNHAPYLGRLHFAARGSLQGAWSARFNDRYQYLQVDFRKPAKVTSVLTQGRQNANQWVTQFRLSSSQDGLSWADYEVQDSIKVRDDFQCFDLVHYSLGPCVEREPTTATPKSLNVSGQSRLCHNPTLFRVL